MRLTSRFEVSAKKSNGTYDLNRKVCNQPPKSKPQTLKRENVLRSLENIKNELALRNPYS